MFGQICRASFENISFSLTIFIRSRKASTNAIECNQFLFSTCNMLSIYWQSFPPSHYFSAWAQMTSTRWVLMYSIVALASYIFRVVFMKSYMDFGLRLTKWFTRSFLPTSFCSQVFGNKSVLVLISFWSRNLDTFMLGERCNLFCFVGYFFLSLILFKLALLLFCLSLFCSNFLFGRASQYAPIPFLDARDLISCRFGLLKTYE